MRCLEEGAVERGGPQVMAPLDPEMAQIVHQHLQKRGVELHLSNAVAGFEKDPSGERRGAPGGGAPPALVRSA